MPEPVVSVRGLRKAYGDIEAVRNVDLEVAAGTVFAFIGPNGAGKTTTVEILEGFRDRDAGEVSVLGTDPGKAGPDWRARIGVVLQDSQVTTLLSVREALELFAGYYKTPRPVAETIALVGLEDQAEQRAGKLSGGQQRRLDVALALIGDPELLFLDEPTTGFDPAARREAWQVIGTLRDLGKTVFLTTHYMEEAQHLADGVAIIKGGVIVAEGTPDTLVADRRRAVIAFEPPAETLTDGLSVAAVPGPRGTVELHTDDPVADLALLCGWARERGLDLPGLRVTRPSLEDVYLELTA